MFRYSVVVLTGLWVAGSAGAATWADTLFNELSKDFGSVPRGPTLTHHFRVVNTTRNPVHISNVRVSCGCVTAIAVKNHLRPGEETTVLTRMDTTRFVGPKSVTIYVQFDRPNFEEVRLWLQANGRNDFHLSPEGLTFGQVKRGAAPSVRVQLTFHGNRDARILSSRAESNYVQPSFVEVRRQEHEVVYTLTAQLRPDTPVGKWFTDVWLKTNSTSIPQIRVPLTVEIESPLTVSPSALTLGALKLNGESERRVIVRGVKPFRVLRVTGTGDDLEVKPSTSEAREVHVLTVRLKGTKVGALERTLRVVTDLTEENEIAFRLSAVVRTE